MMRSVLERSKRFGPGEGGGMTLVSEVVSMLDSLGAAAIAAYWESSLGSP